MDYEAFQSDLMDLLSRYGREGDIACFLFGIAFIDEVGNLRADGCSLVPVPPEDHEEEILRNDCAKKASDLVMQLTENTYLGGGE